VGPPDQARPLGGTDSIERLMRRPARTALLGVTLALLTASAAPTAAAATTVVEMRGLSYAPTLVTFPSPGRSIRWENVTRPSRLHDAFSSLPDYFDTGLLGSGEQATFRFAHAGSFTYICTIHDVMLGRVEVAPTVTVDEGPRGQRLRIRLGLERFELDDPYRWVILVRRPGEEVFLRRKRTRFADGRVPADVPGEWSVMVRLKHLPTGTPSSDSPAVSISVPG
jgi:plastocyanin